MVIITEEQIITFNSGKATFKVNPKIYSLDIVQSAAYILMDKAFIILDGDPEKEITATLEPKNASTDVKEIVHEFNDELLNYAVYKIQTERNQGLREALMKRILLTNEVISSIEEIKREIKYKEEDPEDIFKSWEEKEDGNNTETKTE